jgi:hypothetical protein
MSGLDKVSLTIFCSKDASVEVAEGGYDAEDEDRSFQVSVSSDITNSSMLLTADIHLQDRNNDGSVSIQVSARSSGYTV